MYYSNISHYRNYCFACLVKSTTLNKNEAILYSKLVGGKGVVIFPYPINIKDLKEWLPNLGYYSDFILPPRDYTIFDTSLTFYPDNEEMLVIFNHSETDTEIDIINTKQLPKNINHWRIWDKYDDLWFTCKNDKFDKKYVKSITTSKNFNPQNQKNYKLVRENINHTLKLFPRHPLNTDGMFCPKKDIIEFLKFSKHKLDEPGKEIDGITNHPYTKDYIKKFVIKPNTFIILDQLITQWKSSHISNLSLYPLWYKTEVRKHFNYSI